MIPLGKDIVFQDFTVQCRHAVGSMGCIYSQFRHVNTSVKNNTEGRRDFPAGFFHFTAEPGINFPDYGNNLGTNGRQQGQVPFFKCFLHDSVVGIRKGVAGNQESVLKGNTVFTQQADQFGDCHGGMCIVQLSSHFSRKEGIIAAMTFPVCAQYILHRRRNEHILLFYPKLLSFFFCVVGVKEFGDILGLVFLGGGFRVILAVEGVKINFIEAFSLPETQGAYIFRAKSNDRHIVGHSQNVSGFHGDHNRFIQSPDGPGITIF